MTTYEMADLAQSNFGNGLSTFAVFLSVVSAYLVTAYLVGAKLTRTQVSILTFLFLLVSALIVWGLSAYTNGGVQLSLRANPDSAGNLFAPKSWLPAMLAFVGLLIIAMSLKFMWDVRHPKEKGPN